MAKTYLVTSIITNRPVADNTYRMRIYCPELAKAFRPGQFCMIREPGSRDPLLGRPFAIYDRWHDDNGTVMGVDVMYLIVGKATEGFSRLMPGQDIEIWGPLGNGFSLNNSAKHVILLAGGIGQTPMLSLAKEALKQSNSVTLCYGARTNSAFACLEDFSELGLEMKLATVDGTVPEGYDCQQGFSVDPMKEIFESEPTQNLYVYACGPRPMLIAAQKLMNQYGIRGQMSLETPMACGLGICFTCVAKIQDENGNWDYKRTCKEGPVFDASKILWE